MLGNNAIARIFEYCGLMTDLGLMTAIRKLVSTAEQMKTEYREVISLLRKGYSIRDVAKLSGKGVSTVQRVKRLLKVQSTQ